MVLKKEYPHGVPLRLVDMTCKDVSNEAKNQRESNIHGLADIGKEPSEQSRSAFINRLPEALVKDGKVHKWTIGTCLCSFVTHSCEHYSYLHC